MITTRMGGFGLAPTHARDLREAGDTGDSIEKQRPKRFMDARN